LRMRAWRKLLGLREVMAMVRKNDS
jgi:hypothetical protein